MSREVRRVPLDFDWPLKKVWKGYLMPGWLQGDKCPDCGNGYSPYAQYLHNLWYGYAPFEPADSGCTPLTPDSPAVRAFAERNIASAPEYYGTGEAAIVREGERLAKLWNGSWSHHLTDKDVAALVEADRLHDFTHTFTRGVGWQKKDPPVTPTAEQVNEWSLRGFGHDSINAYVVIKARCEREGEPQTCATCGGHGTVEAYEGQRAESEAWERTDPPTGDGWQFWETVSEGSPKSPVFATADDLTTWLVDHEGYRLSAAQQIVSDGYTIGTLMTATTPEGHPVLLDMARDADIVDAITQED